MMTNCLMNAPESHFCFDPPPDSGLDAFG
jgi:hypothetical protein